MRAFLKSLLRGGAASGGAAYPSSLKYAGEGPLQVLAIGDSWANIPGLEAGLAEGVGGRAVTYGYSGHTAGQIAARLKGGDAAYLSETLGRLPAVVFLVGVNDAYLHVGPRAYGEAVRELRAIGAELADRVHVVEVPRVNMRAPEPWWGSRIKRLVYRWVFDLGATDATDRYRRTAAADITYDDFIASFAGHEEDYAADGLHLRPERYVDLGRHIGRQLNRVAE
ncbi:MAG: GDSL-type esterase/lipase family protein [Pseudomonadota bacterium]